MESWNLRALGLKPRLPEILSSTEEARTIALDLRAGEGLPDHEVHERAWVVVVEGEIEVTSAGGDHASGRPAADTAGREEKSMAKQSSVSASYPASPSSTAT